MKIAPDNSLHSLKKEQRVRLRDDKADVYVKAHAGSEATIKELGVDIGEFPMIFVEWDKKHWLYNGEGDMWTFENHFEPVESEEVSMTEDSPGSDILKQLASMLKPMLENVPKEKPKEDEPEPKELSLRLSKADEYLKILSTAFEAASDAEAFLVLTVKPKNELDGVKVLSPESYMAYSTEPAGYTLNLAVSEISAGLHAEAITRILYENLNELRRNPNQDS